MFLYFRACKLCLDNAFQDQQYISCPMDHDEYDEDELEDLQCQQKGLGREGVREDRLSFIYLRKCKVYCSYGCGDTLLLKELMVSLPILL